MDYQYGVQTALHVRTRGLKCSKFEETLDIRKELCGIGLEICNICICQTIRLGVKNNLFTTLINNIGS